MHDKINLEQISGPRKEMRNVFCPIYSKKGTRRLVSQQGKCLCDERQTCWHVDEEEDSHDEVKDEQGSALELLARNDVSIVESTGQKEVNWGDDERDNCDG